MNRRISKLALTGFRGATTPLELIFDTSKPVAVIFGENGTGKSTIVDAIDFVASGSFGSLEGRQSTPAKEYLPALGSSPSSLRVEMHVGEAAWRANLLGSKASLAGPGGARPGVHVLRRSQILSLLMAKPAERYRQLARFVELPNVEAAERSLREAVDQANTAVNQASVEKATAQTQLEQYWTEEGRPGGAAVDWARALSTKDASALKGIAYKADQIVGLLSGAEALRARVRAAGDDLAKAMEAVTASGRRVREAEAAEQTADARLMALLEKAEDYMAAHPAAEACPVCEQPVHPEALRARLAERRRAGEAVDQARKGLEAAQKEVEKRKATLETSESDLARAGVTMLAAVEASTLAPISSLALDLSTYSLLRSPVIEETLGQAAAQANSLIEKLGAAGLGLQSIQEKATKDAARLTAVRTFLKAVEEQSTKGTRASGLHKQLQAALAIAEKRRKLFVEGVLAGIAGRVCELYEQVHPGEDLGEIALALDPKRRGSLNLTGRFRGAADIPPEGYYSESHLDTLGICVFLAIAERSSDAGRPAILVLDDVLTSVDGPHLDRFMALVQAESDRFDQVIVTTHYRHWFETYKRGQGPARQVQLIELSEWSLTAGMRADCSPLPVDELTALLAKTPLDRQGIASKAGVILESLLTHLSLCFRLRLPASKLRQHTLGELATAVSPPLKASLESQQDGNGPATKLQPIIDAVVSLAPFRNWVGAHYNPLGDDVPNVQVVELGRRAVELARAITCSDCGEMVGKKAGTHWRCRCSKKRLSPLAAPGQDPPIQDVIP